MSRRRLRGTPESGSGGGTAPASGFGDFFATEMAPQGFRDEDAAIRLPVGFKQGDVNAGKRRAGAVEGVAEAVFALGVLEAEVQPAGLVVLEVGAARDFQVAILARRPDLDIV